MASASKSTPMMGQYHRLKKESPEGSLLLFRLGDFYELFFDDAVEGAEILRVALTKRGSTPMCGIPFHAAANYIGRLLKAGRKVAICEQVEEARPGKLVDRRITQVLSPGSHFDERLLSEEKSNYLVAVCPGSTGRYGMAWVDWTTGEFGASEIESDTALLAEMDRLLPAEVVIPEESVKLESLLKDWKTQLQHYDAYVFELDHSAFHLLEHFRLKSLDGFGLQEKPLATAASGAALHYFKIHLRREVDHLTRIQYRQHRETVLLDVISLRNLEILQSRSSFAQGSAAGEGTLFKALNRTVTPMGARRLRDWLTQPLRNAGEILSRQETVQQFLDYPEMMQSFRELLKDVRDLERTLTRLTQGAGGNPRDLVALRSGLQQLPSVRQLLQKLLSQPRRPAAQAEIEGLGSNPAREEDTSMNGDGDGNARLDLAQALVSQIEALPELTDLLQRALMDEPAAVLKDGGFIRGGYHRELDELRSASTDGKNWILQIQQEEIKNTGIPSLKIKYNQVFGYFIEVTRSHLDKVPDSYQRKQTISNGERFITPRLKEVENRILGADERSLKLELEIFQQLRDEVATQLGSIQRTARALAQLDVLASFAEQARLYGYIRPEVGDEGQLDIRDGRHPVLDQMVLDEPFVPNDVQLDVTNQQIALITGPNMAGKSTYIRQVALLVLMAHTGSFIPASRARVDLVDRIFTRIGASDDISRGQSTFMVEMSEAANILNNATRDSLIILDELGRGTSTFDGLSLAWSIVEYLHNQVGARTLFATHYHELTELAHKLARVRNFNVAVREYRDEIVFLRKIVEGGTDKSYGIQVARLAGVPVEVLDRAREILGNLEESELTPLGESAGRRGAQSRRRERTVLQSLDHSAQLDLFTHLSIPSADGDSETPPHNKGTEDE